jgi:putative chitinase
MIHRKWFFDAVRDSLFGGSLSQAQVDGMNALLDRADAVGMDYRQFAYVLATTFHETARTMQPIAEYGQGKGHDYGQPAGPYDQCYYGRGFVQLTWFDNYSKMQGACGSDPTWSGKDIVQVADDALDLKIATDVIFYGMANGTFTGKKLSDYINAQGTDWYSARKIVNALDQASTIQDYAGKFHAALTWTPSTAKTPPTTQAA